MDRVPQPEIRSAYPPDALNLRTLPQPRTLRDRQSHTHRSFMAEPNIVCTRIACSTT
jgi:hypothetical protein